MRLGEFKPKGSDKTIREWVESCTKSCTTCGSCLVMKECRDIFGALPLGTLAWTLDFEVEV